MKEYMFYIKNDQGAKSNMSTEQHLAFIKQCETYIEMLKEKQHLIAAQPIDADGISLSKKNETWWTTPIESSKINVGYYHIIANNIEEAIHLAKQNPEFMYIPSASIDIHAIKTKETETGFIYPSNS